MNNVTTLFVEELTNRPEVQGVILFGSWARGNNRQDSDVDLLVVLDSGFKRTVEFRDGQAFEVTYTNENSALEYWENNLDDCYNFWEVAVVLVDKTGAVKKIHDKVKELISKGKTALSEDRYQHLLFDTKDQLSYLIAIKDSDPVTANFLLYRKVYHFTELFFDLKQLWTTAPKQRLEKIKTLSPQLYTLISQFYSENLTLDQKIDLAQQMISVIFVSNH